MAGEYSFYLNSDFSQYAGQWIALVGKKVVAHDNNAKKAYLKAKKEFPNNVPFLTCIQKTQVIL